MQRGKCIYCLEEKESGEFNKEHVLSSAFGSYWDAPRARLHCVCKSCNDFFGHSIDFYMARATFEGLLRYTRADKRPSAHSLADAVRRLDGLQVAESGPFQDALLTLEVTPGSELRAVLVPQVGLRMGRWSRWKSLPLCELLQMDAAELPPYDEIRVFGATNEELDALKRKIETSGRPLPSLHEMPMPSADQNSIWAEIQWTVNDSVRRAIAKTALNYAALEEGAEFVLRRCFDDLRNYIRNGIRCEPPLVGTSTRSPDKSRTCNGHYIALEMDRTFMVTAYVSLFNTLTYRVILTRHYDGPYRPLAHGLYYDPDQRHVDSMRKTRLWIPPP